MKNVTRKRYFEQSDKDEEHSNNDVMTKSQKRTVNKLRQQMAKIWSQRTMNQWRYGQKLKKPRKNDAMEKYWKSAENDVIENHEAKNH